MIPGDQVVARDLQGIEPLQIGRIVSMRDGQITTLRLSEGTPGLRHEVYGTACDRYLLTSVK